MQEIACHKYVLPRCKFVFLFLSHAEMMKLYSRGVLPFPLTSRFVNLPYWARYTAHCRTGKEECVKDRLLPRDPAHCP